MWRLGIVLFRKQSPPIRSPRSQPYPRAAMAMNKGSETRKRCWRHSWQVPSISVLPVVLRRGFSHQPLPNGIWRFLLRRLSRVLSYKEGAEGGGRAHDDGNTGFDILPKDLPGCINLALDTVSTNTNEGNKSHYYRKAQKRAQPKFSREPHLSFIKDEHGNADN